MSDKVTPTPDVPVVCRDCGCAVGSLQLPHAWDQTWAAPASASVWGLSSDGILSTTAVLHQGALLWRCPRCKDRPAVGQPVDQVVEQYRHVVGTWYSDPRNARQSNLRVAPISVPRFT